MAKLTTKQQRAYEWVKANPKGKTMDYPRDVNVKGFCKSIASLEGLGLIQWNREAVRYDIA